VNFIGDNTHAAIPRQNIYDFKSKLHEFSKSSDRLKNNQWLQNSISIALKMLKGKIQLSELEKVNSNIETEVDE